jgi:hypothetical protein
MVIEYFLLLEAVEKFESPISINDEFKTKITLKRETGTELRRMLQLIKFDFACQRRVWMGFLWKWHD